MSLYRSPSTCIRTALDDLEAILMTLSPHVHSVVIAGDLNVDLLSHDSYSAAYEIACYVVSCCEVQVEEPISINLNSWGCFTKY